MKIFADDVIGTKFDQKYFQCILSEYLINFESFPPENGIVEVSLNDPKRLISISSAFHNKRLDLFGQDCRKLSIILFFRVRFSSWYLEILSVSDPFINPWTMELLVIQLFWVTKSWFSKLQIFLLHFHIQRKTQSRVSSSKSNNHKL